jgi:hypothetical protein
VSFTSPNSENAHLGTTCRILACPTSKQAEPRPACRRGCPRWPRAGPGGLKKGSAPVRPPSASFSLDSIAPPPPTSCPPPWKIDGDRSVSRSSRRVQVKATGGATEAIYIGRGRQWLHSCGGRSTRPPRTVSCINPKCVLFPSFAIDLVVEVDAGCT